MSKQCGLVFYVPSSTATHCRMPSRSCRFTRHSGCTLQEEVTYHPLLQTFTDSKSESAARAAEKEAVVGHLNRARDRQLSTECEYNILNMRNKRSGLPAPAKPPTAAPSSAVDYEAPRFRHPLDSCYPFNIVSNVPLSQHHYTAPCQRPNVPENDWRADATDVLKPRLQTVKGLPRDYNILSNKYVEEHDAKM